MSEIPSIKVTCAILEHDGRVLVTQRSQNMSQPLMWEFPGGKIEQGEEEQACLVREIQEELHVTVEPITRLTPVVHDYGKFVIQLIPYVCRYIGGNIKLAEHMAYEWSAPTELKKYNWCPADIPIVEEYLEYRLNNK